MDAAGAKRLRWRIEQQEHWQLADAVRDGRQPPVDPDGNDLVDVGHHIRLYRTRATSEGNVRICKRLVDGFWTHGMVPAAETGTSDTAEAAHVA